MTAAQPRAARWLVALAVGTAVGATALAGYALSIRVPVGGRSAVVVASAGGWLTTSLVLAAIATIVAFALGAAALAGIDVRRWAAALLFGVVAIVGSAFLNSGPDDAAAALSGPGARPAVALSLTAWPLLAAAALVLLAGAVWGRRGDGALRAATALLSPLLVVGLIVPAVVGVAVAKRWDVGQVHPHTVPAITVPDYPTSLGADVAYSVRAEGPENVLPAGPGFVVFAEGGGIQAFDGATGAPRWNVPAEVFPRNCSLRGAHSTGTSADSVVVAECVRPQLQPPSGDYPDDDEEPVLLGFDANTGNVLWLNDQNFGLADGGSGSDAILAVARRGEIGSLDPHTGAVRWLKPGNRHPCDKSADVVGDDVVVTPCWEDTTLRVFDGMTGDERDVPLPILPGAKPATTTVSMFSAATDGGVVVVTARIQRGPDSRDEYVTVAVDVTTDNVVAVGNTGDVSPRAPRPGALLGVSLVDPMAAGIYRVAERRLVEIPALDVGSSYAGSGRTWAPLGDGMVTAAARDADRNAHMATAAGDGTVTERSLPCPNAKAIDTEPGVVAVPGALLVVCPPSMGRALDEWNVVALR